MKFKNKVVLITWASKWIWRATALYFWKEWASVIVNYLNSEENAFKVVDAIKKMWSNSIAIKWDVSDENQVINMVNESIKIFWKIDILINNAWIISNEIPLLDKKIIDFKNTLNVNIIGTFLCSKYVWIEMLKKWNWKIINVSSINWTKHFYPEQIDYDISKAWIIVLTKNFAKEFWPNIYVNAIAPWNIDNVDESIPSWNSSDEDTWKIYLWRFWKITEIVKWIIFLASNDSSFINWTTLFLDWWND